MPLTDQIKKGITIRFRDEPHLVTEARFFNPGRGAAFIQAKLKNLISGRTVANNFRSGEKVEELELQTQEMQYLYSDTESSYFMDPTDFEQKALPLGRLGDLRQFLKEGEAYQIILDSGTVLSIRFPAKVTLKVVEAAGATRGNTATSATKSVTLETGAKISVPLFVKAGDSIVVNTDTGSYISRS